MTIEEIRETLPLMGETARGYIQWLLDELDRACANIGQQAARIAELEATRPQPSLPEVIDAFEALCKRMFIFRVTRSNSITIEAHPITGCGEHSAPTLKEAVAALAANNHAALVEKNSAAEQRVEKAIGEAREAFGAALESRELLERLGEKPC